MKKGDKKEIPKTNKYLSEVDFKLLNLAKLELAVTELKVTLRK